MTDAPAPDRVRKLLLSADNALKNAGPRATPERLARVRATLEEAREAALDPAVDERVRELVERRLATLGEAAP
jgi:hypothetical protein